MFEPQYRISPPLLDTIKRITVLVHELNQRVVPEIALAQLQAEAQAISTFASASIEGSPLPLTEVKRLLKNRPQHLLPPSNPLLTRAGQKREIRN